MKLSFIKNLYCSIYFLIITRIVSKKIIFKYRLSKLSENVLAKGLVRVVGEANRIEIGKNLRLSGTMSLAFGKEGKGELMIGDNVVLEHMSALSPRDGFIHINSDVFIGPNVVLQSYYNTTISVGVGVMIGKDSNLYASNHDLNNPLIGYRSEIGGDIFIGDNVWIGAAVTVLSGVTIGAGSVIAAGSVVVDRVDPFCIYAGVPAKKIKYFNFERKTWERFSS